MEAGGTPNLASTAAASMKRPARRSKVSTRPSSRTHWAMSLSGERITTRSTSGCSAKRTAAAARASSASNSTIGQTTTPSASRASSSEPELGQQLRGHAGLGLVARVALVAPGADDVVGGAAEVRDAVLAQQREHRLHDAQGRGHGSSLGVRHGAGGRSARGTARRSRRGGGPARRRVGRSAALGGCRAASAGGPGAPSLVPAVASVGRVLPRAAASCAARPAA